MKLPELLSGVGDFPALNAAIKAGADAVFFGCRGEFSMRAFGENFEESQIPKIVQTCHENNVKTYLTINSIIYEEELERISNLLKKAADSGVDAVILSDMAVLKAAKDVGLEIHLSTQQSVSNSASVELFKMLGVSRIVLARELTLEQIKSIKEKTGMEIECFVHGAMCVAVSGRCFMGHELFNESANRGKCLQPCRRVWMAEDPSKQLVIGENYILSPKDMCLIDHLDKLVEAKIDSFKIEGRTKPADYVYTTTSCYRKGLDAIANGNYTPELASQLLEELKTVYNREFTPGHYFNTPFRAQLVKGGKSHQTKRRILIGQVENYYDKSSAAEIKLFNDIELGKNLVIEGKTTYLQQELSSMQKHGSPITSAVSGERIGIKVSEKVRPNDKVYVMVEVKELGM